METQQKIEAKALKASMVGAFILALWGLLIAALSQSGAVLLDGMYNLVSAIMTFFSIEITRLIFGRETREYPLGYFAFESLFVFVKGAAILVLVLMALYANIAVLLAGGREPALGLLTLYVGLAVIGCFGVYGILRKSLRKTASDLLRAEAKAWLLNGAVTGAIGLAFVVVLFIQDTGFGWIARYVDQILVIGMSLLFIKEPLILMRSGLRELLLAAPQEAFSKPFIDRIQAMQAELGARHLSFEILKTGRRLWVTVFMDPAAEVLEVNAFMDLKARLQEIAREVHPQAVTELVLERKGRALQT